MKFQSDKMVKITPYYLISTALKGISQVILIDNVISGLIILIAITIGDYRLGIVALVSAIIGTLIAYAGGADKDALNQGLFGYNSVLTGLALALFLTDNFRWIIALIGAAFVTIFTAAMMHFFKGLEMPVLTFPYILLTWLLLLTSYHLGIFKLTKELVPQDLSHWKLHIEGNISIINGLIDGIGQVYFLTGLLVGILVLLAAFWANWKLGIYTLLGTGIGWLTAYVLVPEYTLLNVGLYGYNAVLTILAVASVFNADSSFAPISGVIAAIITVPITASVDTWLAPYGLPALTMPFVLVTWIFIGARKVLFRL